MKTKLTAEEVIELILDGWETDDEALELYNYIMNAEIVDIEELYDRSEVNELMAEYINIMHKRENGDRFEC